MSIVEVFFVANEHLPKKLRNSSFLVQHSIFDTWVVPSSFLVLLFDILSSLFNIQHSSVRHSLFLRFEYHFADILSLLDIPVGVVDLIKRKRGIDVRIDPAVIDAGQDLLHPLGGFVAFMPQMTEVDAEDAAVFIQQRQRVINGHADDRL